MSSSERWVCVTGASSGIGEALAVEFARNGYNVFLTARNVERLQEVAASIEAKYSVLTEVLAADLSDVNETEQLISQVAKRRYDVLVNNAGFAIKGNFAETSLDQELELVDVQLGTMLKLTKAVLPKMVQSRRGIILNVASVYSFSPVPQQSVYGATKAFILNFSAALQHEVKDSRIQVSTVCPGVTQTSFRSRAGIADDGESGMPAEAVARVTYRELMKGRRVIVPGFQNKLFVFITKFLSPSASASLLARINRKRGINK